ncbi:OmpA family protein [Roseivirga sp.]|uniref:OmpA family protein n=1 Tax=Roseivirga sp. TaxID=1964215 RepID=UPI002B276025|nr:OmpA family protein [Roseivirga sp.]
MRNRIQITGILILALLVGCKSSQNFLGVDTPSTSTKGNQPSNTQSDSVGSLTNGVEEEIEKTKEVKIKKSYENANYNLAIEDYKKELEDDPESPVYNYYVAESYRKTNRIFEATDYYAKAIEGGFADDEMELHYAQALKASERYNDAKNVLQNYLQYATVESFVDRAKNELKNLDKLDSIGLNVRNIDIKNAEGINTENAEYSPYFFNNELYFATGREQAKFERYGIPFTDLYKIQSNGLNMDASSIEKLSDLFNDEEINEGSIAFSPDGNSVVFAKGNSADKRGRFNIDLFISTKRNGEWTKPQIMPINSPDSWDTSPTFSGDGKTIYFASDRPGGLGGSDIYRTRLNDRGRWGDVQNMGPTINTPEDEMFPYVSPDNKLYFSSTGHAGFGMLDVFVGINEGGNITIQNMGPSINSSYDDFGLVYSDFPFEGFFSSNRPGGKGDDDIYTFIDNSSDLKQIEYVLSGVTYQLNEDSTQSILADVRVKLMSTDNQVVDDQVTGRGGVFQFVVDPEREYILLGEKANFFAKRRDFSTVGEAVRQEDLIERFTTKKFESSLTLDPIILDKTIVLENIYYDLDKAEIRPDAAIELDKLVELLNDNPNIKIELSSHTDSRGEDAPNLDLSERRAQAAVRYLILNGISQSRLVAKGYGESQLINGCVNDADCTEDQHQQNRRTEFKVIEYNGN